MQCSSPRLRMGGSYSGNYAGKHDLQSLNISNNFYFTTGSVILFKCVVAPSGNTL